MDFLTFAPAVSFVLFWCLMLFAQARMSGWSQLASRYRSENNMADWRAWQSGALGPVNFKSSLWIAPSAEGLYLKTGPFLLFRPFHPTLLIPWNDMVSVEEKPGVALFVPAMVEIKLKEAHMQIKLPAKAFNECQRFLGNRLILLEKRDR